MSLSIKKITILALGLIGGSLAKSLKANGFSGQIVAWGPRLPSLQKGLELGLIDSYSLELAEAVANADVVVIATPTLTAAQMMHKLAPLVSKQTIITDVASVKGNLLAAARQAFGSVPPRLVLAHPIAGSEKSGVEAANAHLFVNHRVILTPNELTDPDAVAIIQAMWQLTGAQLVSMPVAEHDQVLAATSHLPHILAYALVDALAGNKEQQNIFRFAAGGFRDFTRIASSDPTMWRDIALANTDAIVDSIDQFSDKLNTLREAIVSQDSDTLMTSFKRAKSARDLFAELLEQQNQQTISDE